MRTFRFLSLIVFLTLGFFHSSAGAEDLAQLFAVGPYQTEELEFPKLRDPKRGGRSVPIKLHLPKNTPTGPLPIVIVSHGGGGSWDANFSQARHLASHGYAVVCLEHVGSNTERLRRGFRFMRNLLEMTRDADEVFARPRDVSFAIDVISKWNSSEQKFSGRFDLNRIGVLGHSFGAYTALAVCGARPALNWLKPRVEPGAGLGLDLSDSRVKACVALSPQGPGEPFFLEESYASVSRPVLGISGSKDEQQNSTPENRRRFFELLPPGDKYFVWLENADHPSFSDSSGSGRRGLRSASRVEVQPIARAATLLFFDGYLRYDKRTALSMLSQSGLGSLTGKIVTGIAVSSK